jgi:segregation and condensation protein A
VALEYIVQLDDYEGPLDRLLRLVEKKEIDAASVPVYVVVRQLVSFLEAVSYADIDEGGRFLVLAATLLAIKAQLVLPEQEAAAGKEGVGWDEEDVTGGLAVSAEAEYLLIKEAARTLEDYARNWVLSYKRPPHRELQQQAEQDLGDDVARLVTAFKEILIRVDIETLPYQVEMAVDFENKMELVFGKIASHRGGLPFRQLFVNIDRIEVIYSFMAVLELVFRGRLRLSQRDVTGEIILVPVKLRSVKRGGR